MEGTVVGEGASRSLMVRDDLLAILLPMAIIFVAEAFFFDGQLETVVAIHALNVLVCLFVPMALRADPFIFQAFSLVSILRILNVGMPSFDTLTLHWLPVIYAPMIVVAVLMLREENTERVSGGETPIGMVTLRTKEGMHTFLYNWRDLPIPILAGYLLANIEFTILDNGPLGPDLSIDSLLLLGGVMVFFIGLGEELLFRAILQRRLGYRIGVLGAILVSSLVFAAMHSGYSSVPYLFYVFFASVFFGITYESTRSVALVAIFHGALNFFLFSFLPYGELLLF